jgi:hypothetical protein
VVETGGDHPTVLRAGFVHGLRMACPVCRLTELPVSQVSRDALVVQGVDVVFTLPGPAANDVVNSLVQAGFWVVWAGLGSPAPVADHLVGEVVLKPEVLVVQALEPLVEGSQGQSWPYTIEDGGLAIERLNAAAISPGRERILSDLVAALSAGELEIGVDPVTGEER